MRLGKNVTILFGAREFTEENLAADRERWARSRFRVGLGANEMRIGLVFRLLMFKAVPLIIEAEGDDPLVLVAQLSRFPLPGLGERLETYALRLIPLKGRVGSFRLEDEPHVPLTDLTFSLKGRVFAAEFGVGTLNFELRLAPGIDPWEDLEPMPPPKGYSEDILANPDA